MLSLKNLLVTFSIVIFITLASGLGLVAPAEATTVSFQWTGKAGYSAKGLFSYDPPTVPTIVSEKGAGKTNVLQSLVVTFYTPSGAPIGTYDNVVNGVAQGHFFEFNFDPTTQQIVGRVDLGGELAGEIYLKGTVDDELSLFSVDKSGFERIIDRGSDSLAAFRQVSS
ncbi:MAG: hypothetical protein IGR93_05305 [Hydrococcus sp. C42_A2020_068]|uniref:hypothetical protein n=1 Tax=Pleurocapsa sp. PCC 7327 TaxID=118163 RepID=UPI00029FDDF6|nr:hypothetical protein [Pleurocapsa sp. PCC 7327]AFY76925.1 hypothetical protein Ple7327_1550 [Pleurocapsa sp. PCC 7327]MBF2019528.1 hypothetical protein [Hydrococcus sp. C42_A2020_068]